jgi:hypothetical protein
MRCTGAAVVALGAGYLLGRRRRKQRTATDSSGGIASQLSEIVDAVRGDLTSAVTEVATAAVVNRLNSVADSLHDRTERLRSPGATAADAGQKGADTGEEAADADEAEDSGEEDQHQGEDEAPVRGATARSRPPVTQTSRVTRGRN